MLDGVERHLEKTKWVLPVLFIIGYFLTFKSFSDNFLEYLICNLVAAASCMALLLTIRLHDQKFVAVWVAFILLVMLYFVRFYWITLDPTPVRYMLPQNPYIKMINSSVSQLLAFKLSVLAFAGFSCSTAAMIFYINRKNVGNRLFFENPDSNFFGMLSMWFLIVTTLTALVFAYLTYKYKIGEMGVSPGEPLPFRLKGLIFYARTVSIPLAILLAIYLAECCGNLTTARLGIFVLVMNGVADMVLRSSRSGLLLSLVLLVFLMLAGGIRLRRKEKLIFALLIPIAFITVPFMTEYRNIRMNSSLSHVEAFFGALNLANSNSLNQLFKGFQFVMFRLPGIESLWCMIASGAEPLGVQSLAILDSKNGIAGYLTNVIYPLKVSDNTLLAPGFVGWFYLVAGWPAIVAGAMASSILSFQVWSHLGRNYLAAGPIAKVFFLWVLFLALTEGTLDNMRYMFFAGVLTVMAFELGLQYYKKIRINIDRAN